MHFADGGLRLEELHRFPNNPVTVRGTLYWDILRLWREVQAGIAKGTSFQPASLGVDAWGVDFVLLDAQGDLLGNPVHYRDPRTAGMLERAFARVPKENIFAQTGIQFISINTLYQLLSLVARQSPQLAMARTFLTIPDLFHHWLSGSRACEFTIATTTQLFDPRAGTWASELLRALEVPCSIFPPIVQPGTRLGTYEGMPVIAPACHDTASAVAAVPARTPRFAYISSGTWSLVGLEVSEPLINVAALAANVTNEGGVAGTYRLLKNVMGLWLLQQCRAIWASQGHAYTYVDLVSLAQAAPPLRSFVNPDDARFLSPGDHPQWVQAWCAEHGQPVPETHGAIVRCVLDSLALTYRAVLETLHGLVGYTSNVVHIVGGGARNDLLCQLTANATALPVVAGPVEATVLGNALVQLIALRALGNMAEARQRVASMGGQQAYEPQDRSRWEEAYQRFREVVRQ